jgi:hypothetical protein
MLTIEVLKLLCSRLGWIAAGSHLSYDLLALIVDSLADWLIANLLLGLASTVIFDAESHGTHDHILLSDRCGSPQTFSTDCLLSCPRYVTSAWTA